MEEREAISLIYAVIDKGINFFDDARAIPAPSEERARQDRQLQL